MGAVLALIVALATHPLHTTLTQVAYRDSDRTLELTRDVTYSDADVLAKESEEQLLYRDMQGDMVQQIIRRLSAAHKPKA